MQDNTSKYYDISYIIRKRSPISVIIGGRGIGKTFGFLSWLSNNHITHIYLRRTQNEIDLCANEYINPYKAINDHLQTKIQIKSKENLKVIQNGDEFLGYACALSTFGNIRGADFSDVDVILFDEAFGKRKIKNEGNNTLDLYETVARNRESNGKPYPMLIILSNAYTLNTDILSTLGIIPVLEHMVLTGKMRHTENNITIELPADLQITAEKKQSKFYKAIENTSYYNHSLNNEFLLDDYTNVKKLPIIEFYPIASYLNLHIYKHKSSSIIYITSTPTSLSSYTPATKKSFLRDYGILLTEYHIRNNIFYESISLKNQFQELLNLKP